MIWWAIIFINCIPFVQNFPLFFSPIDLIIPTFKCIMKKERRRKKNGVNVSVIIQQYIFINLCIDYVVEVANNHRIQFIASYHVFFRCQKKTRVHICIHWPNAVHLAAVNRVSVHLHHWFNIEWNGIPYNRQWLMSLCKVFVSLCARAKNMNCIQLYRNSIIA